MTDSTLVRRVGLIGAVLLGLGSILGSGIFVSAGLGAAATGPSVVLAIVAAGLLAYCNGLASAQLAVAVPRSGGTYEYGHVYLRPWVGFSAGWLFLSAKSASAASAAIGMVAMLERLLALLKAPSPAEAAWGSPSMTGVLAALVVLGVVLLAASGVRRSSRANFVLVSFTVLSLLVFAFFALRDWTLQAFIPFFAPITGGPALPGFFEAVALMFVAFTGYGRVATLGEEITEPERNIPKAIIFTVVAALAIYIVVSAGALNAMGTSGFARSSLANQGGLVLAPAFGKVPGWLGVLLAAAGCTALLGVILNLVLGLSRVVFAMGRRGDLPRSLGAASSGGEVPTIAVYASALLPLLLALLGSLKLAWSFSAFTVLVYYGITNAAALRQPPAEQRYARWSAYLGLAGCLGLAVFIEWQIQLAGLAWIGMGLAGRRLLRRA